MHHPEENRSEGLWTSQSLAAAIKGLDKAERMSCNSVDDSDVLEVTVGSAGDLVLHIVVGEVQILTSAILWPRGEQEDPAAFEAMMLRTHKTLLPLCALSIDVVDGEEVYELFGAVSRSASLTEVLGEFFAIAESALELARDIGPRSAEGDAA